MDTYRTRPCSEGLYCSKVLYKDLLKNLYSRLKNKEIGGGTSNRIAANNQHIFIPKKISAQLFALICVLTLAACGGGKLAGDPGGGSPGDGSGGEIETKLSTPIGVSNLKIIPNVTSATLSWNNPDTNIAQINIIYQNTTADSFEKQENITDNDSIRPNVTVTKVITGLTNGTSYIFNVLLELDDADENKRVVARERTRQIGPNLDGDEYADADPLELDKDGDGVNNERDAYPDDATLFGFAVTGLQATPGIGNVTLSWNNPSANISSINISYHNGSAPDVLQYLPLITNRTKTGMNTKNVRQVITDLTNEEPYTFNVSLTLTGTDAGREGAAASVTVTPGIFAVIGLQAAPGAGNVTLSWNNPSANISSINISYQRDGSNDVQYWDLITAPAQIESNEMSVQETITGLTNGELYTFNVSLTLDGADADRKVAVASVTATPDIFAVTELQATPGVSSVTLSWNNPAANIASINISYQRDGSNDVQYWDLITAPAQIETNKIKVQETIYGLTNGESYTFNVSLTLKDADAGREGAAASVTATPDIFVVTILEAIPRDRGVALSWNNPAADIVNINISYRRDGSTDVQYWDLITVPTQIETNKMNVQQVITDLTNEEYYTFTIDLTLGVDYASRKGAAPSIRVAIGPDLDGDKYADFVDDDENGDGVDDIDTDGDGIHDFKDPDANGDGRPDRDSDNDGIFDYLDTDDDNDTIPDEADVDDDGDGLIEIATAEQLNQTRHNLLGSSFKLSPGDTGNATGCGAPLTSITECNGYELSNDISLADYDNWEPIGSCLRFSGSTCTPVNEFFNTIFDGNGYIISNLTITNPVAPYTNASGLFGAINSAAVLRNIHIRSANITGGENNVGMLVGYVEGSRKSENIINSSTEGNVNASGSNAGGLIGYGSNAKIISSWTAGGTVSGGDYVGGLVGSWSSGDITSSYAEVQYVSGVDYVGGLIGFGGSVGVRSSYASGAVSGDADVGGLAGQGFSLDIEFCYVTGGSVSATGISVGGLVGSGYITRITTSYAAGGSVSGDANVGGLIGNANFGSILSSYAAPASLSKTDGSDIDTGDNFGGLMGARTGNGITFSFWDSDTSGITDGGITGMQEPKTTTQLQTPTTLLGSIYAGWDVTNRCDDGFDAWDFGTISQYPALTCPPGGVAPQRP